MRWLFILALLTPIWAFALTPTPTGSSFSVSVTSTTTVDLSAVTPGAGSNTALMVIGIANGSNNGAITGCSFGGTGMAQIYSVAGARFGGGIMYFLANPGTTAHDVVCTQDASHDIDLIAFTLQNVVQNSSTTVDVAGANTQGAAGCCTSNTNTNTTLTNNDIVLGWTKLGQAAASLVAGQTLIASLAGWTSGIPAGGIFTIEYTGVPSAGPQAMTYSWTNATAYDMWTVSLKGTAGTVIPLFGYWAERWW